MSLKTALIGAQKKFKTHGITSASLDAEVLLLHALGRGRRRRDKSWLYLNLERYQLSAQEEKIFEEYVKRRLGGEPIAYITQTKEFYGLDFFVNESVLIPRVETELLVDNSLALLRREKKKFTLLDLGTGSGCIPISIAQAAQAEGLDKYLGDLLADDVSAAALATAKKNARRHGLARKINFLHAELADALANIKGHERVIVTANLPYITPRDYEKLAPGVRKFEPRLALRAEENGLALIYHLLDNFAALSRNFADYHLLLEADPRQMRSLKARAQKALPGCGIELVRDLRGKTRLAIISKQK